MIHLTHTGFYAGRLLCSKPRENGEYVHAVYAPLHKPEYRQIVCLDCLRVYARDAYDETDEDIPEWIQALRGANL